MNLPERRATDEDFVTENAGVVEEVSRCHVVSAVENNVKIGNEVHRVKA